MAGRCTYLEATSSSCLAALKCDFSARVKESSAKANSVPGLSVLCEYAVV